MVTTWLANITFHLQLIWLQTLVGNGRYRFRITPDIISKLLRTAIWSSCAVLFGSEQTPCPRTGHNLFATYFAANFDCDWFRIMPYIVSILLRAAIWSRCAVQLESEQTTFPRPGRQLRSAALHRIRLGTCSSVPMSYFYSETNEWLQDWVEFHFPMKKKYVVTARYLQSIKTF